MLKLDKRSYKLIILTVIIGLEIAVGGLVLYKPIRSLVMQQKILGSHKVATIDQDSITRPEESELKYYWEFKPYTAASDNPEWLEKEAVYHINSDGLNDTQEYSIDQSENTFRIITLGDSFTYGHFVSVEDNWTEQLEKRLNDDHPTNCYNKFEVINLGMPGFDVEYIVKRYQDIGVKYNPDLVIWFESGSGFHRFRELTQPLIEECEKDKPASMSATLDYASCWIEANEQISSQYSHDYLVSLISTQYEKLFSLIDPQQVKIFVTDTTFYHFIDQRQLLENKFGPELYTPLFSQIFEYERLPDGHPNPRGHQHIAQEVYRHLENEFFTECE